MDFTPENEEKHDGYGECEFVQGRELLILIELNILRLVS